jgi:intracellular septation protein
VVLIGGLTILFKDETFIKLKPTIVNLLFAAILLYGHLTKKPFLSYLLGAQIKISNHAWLILSKRWACYFIGLAILNEVIWRNFPTDFWVQFKVFGMLPLSIIFMASQMPFIMREAQKFEKNS